MEPTRTSYVVTIRKKGRLANLYGKKVEDEQSMVDSGKDGEMETPTARCRSKSQPLRPQWLSHKQKDIKASGTLTTKITSPLHLAYPPHGPTSGGPSSAQQKYHLNAKPTPLTQHHYLQIAITNPKELIRRKKSHQSII